MPEQPPNGEHSNTAPKVRKGGVPFAKGNDPRRNLKGRPKSFDALRALAQSIAHEEVQIGNGEVITRADAIMRQWASSDEPQLQARFVEIAFGKVPDETKISGLPNTTIILTHAHESSGERRSPALTPSSN